jgi:hypothetical protein
MKDVFKDYPKPGRPVDLSYIKTKQSLRLDLRDMIQIEAARKKMTAQVVTVIAQTRSLDMQKGRV